MERISTNTPLPCYPYGPAGYFTSRAVELQPDLGTNAQNDWDSKDWVKQGTKFACSKAAVRWADRALPRGSSDYEDRFTRLVIEGETGTDTIIGETFDEDSW